MIRRRFVIAGLGAILLPAFRAAPSGWTRRVTAPGGRLSAVFRRRDGSIEYRLDDGGTPLIDWSPIGLKGIDIAAASHLRSRMSRVRERWAPQWAQASTYRDDHVALSITAKLAGGGTLVLEARLYDAGLAMRVRLAPSGNTQAMVREATGFRLASDWPLYAVNGEQPPHGPVPASHFGTIASSAQLPIVVDRGADGAMAIHEAALDDFTPLMLRPDTGHRHGLVAHDAVSALPHGGATPWRVILVGKDMGALLTSPMLPNLCRDGTQAMPWVKPGAAMWDWRVRGAHARDGQRYAMDTASMLRFVDFAAEAGLAHFQIDANWYGPEHDVASDPLTPIPELDLGKVIERGRRKDVGILLYLNDKALVRHDAESIFATYAKMGAAGVKLGFMAGTGQQKVRKTITLVEAAARHRLLINFHDRPITPSGLYVRYPNWISQEYCHGQHDDRRAFDPETFLKMAFVNAVAGPLDMSNGNYALNDQAVAERRYVFEPVHSTVAGETARTLVIFSGVSLLPGSPEDYRAKGDLFDFIARLPFRWDESRVLDGHVSSHVVVARRHGREWFVAAANGPVARTVTIPLDFLEPSTEWIATIYADSSTSHYVRERETYEIRETRVRAATTMNLGLAAGGGQAIRLRPA